MSRPARMLGLSALAVALLALAGCKTEVAGDQSEMLTCSSNQIPDETGTMCVDRPLECEGGKVLDEAGEMCVDAPFAGPDPVYFPAEDEAVIYFNRQHIDQAYSDWVLHLWSDGCTGGWATQVTDEATAPTSWPAGPSVNGDGTDPIYGAYWVLKIKPDSDCGHYIVHNRAGDSQTNNNKSLLNNTGKFARMSFVIADYDMRGAQVSEGLPICINDVCEPAEPPARAIRNAAAHWIDASTLVWNSGGGADKLYAASAGGMDQDEQGNITGSEISASLVATTLTDAQAARVPHLAGWPAYTVEGLTAEQVVAATRGQIWVTGTDGSGSLVGTEVQTARLLDALYTQGEDDADEAELGVVYADGNITVSVWAPTAHDVRLKVFNEATPKRLLDTVAMTLDPATGIWSYTDSAERLNRRFYRFGVTQYDRENDVLVNLESTDPYSVGAAERSHYSQFVNLNDADTQPEGWGSVAAPALVAPENAVIYEGHVRDFSIRDESTSEANRGKYLAFTESGSAPMQHLAELKASGLTHFHALPTADIATIDEVAEARVELTDTVAELCQLAPSAPVCGVEANSATLLSLLEGYEPTSDDAKNLVEAMREFDGFNWGYDPLLFNVPEGSYASDADGIARIKELRAMNQALNALGLRTVMDVVYNHTSGAGLVYASSTFDKLVPGYYYRRDPITGAIETVSCCNDSAPENVMFGKFVVESLVHWAKHYGYNDFRFDLMTFIPKSVVLAARDAVHAFAPDSYFYGEGWDMGGSSDDDAIFERAVQHNMAGTGVGTFNDVMRDPMRYLDLVKGNNVDKIRIGLAGNLSGYEFYNTASARVTGATVGGYTDDPQESINYVSKHDNETLWDMIQKQGALDYYDDAENFVSTVSAANRARIQNLTQSMNMLSQGVPFFHMGSDLLRSKSMDRNTYDAGDWYNYVDFTQRTNNWAVGMPLDRGDSSEDWIRTQFNNANTLPVAADIALASDVFNEFLTLSQGSPLFSLATLADIQARLGFHNTGTDQVDGVIAMSLDDGVGLPDLDPAVDAIMVVFNGNGAETAIDVRTASGFTLHPVQAASADALVRDASFSESVRDEDGENVTYGTFTVPAYTTAVFVKAQSGAQGPGMAADATVPATGAIDNPFDVGVYLRGDMTGWSTDSPFFYSSDGVFTAFADLTAATTYGFKFASADWSTVNFGNNTGLVEVDTAKALNPGEGNLSFTPSVTGRYRFSVNVTTPGAPVLTISRDLPSYANTLYLKGDMNGWGDVDAMTYLGDNLYSLELTLAVGDQFFKIADTSWGAPNLGGQSANQVLAANGQLGLQNGSGDNLTVSVGAGLGGDYRFNLNATNTEQPVLDMVAVGGFQTDLYIKGSMNSWGNGNPMTHLGGGIHQLDITLTAGGYEFKFATATWESEFTCACLLKPFEKAQLQRGGGNSQLVVEKATVNYRITLDTNFAEPRVTVVELP